MKRILTASILSLLTVAVLFVPTFATEPENPAAHTHTVENWTPEGSLHSGPCTLCGETVTQSHGYNEGIVTTAPTCKTDGIKTFTCICGHFYEETIPGGHTFDQWVSTGSSEHQHTCTTCGYIVGQKHTLDKGEVITPATCTKEGSLKRKCTVCDYTKTSDISKLDHTYTNDCDFDCNVCGHLRRITHKYETKWTTDSENHWHECSICGDDGDLDAHVPTDWIIDVPAGEYTDGQQHRDCSVCNRFLGTEVIPATGCLHGNEQLQNTKEPSCAEEGYTGDWVCPRCLAVVTPGEPIPTLPHNTQLENQLDPTCALEGYTGDHICVDCRAIVTEGTPIEKLPHTTQLENQRDPTCILRGYTGDHVCVDCRTIVTTGTDIEKLPHVPQLENQQDPTCTQEGYTGDYICISCQTTLRPGKAVEKIPHDTERKNISNPDCTTPGYTGDECCKNCLAIIESGTEIPELGHEFNAGFCLECMAPDPDYVVPTQPNPNAEMPQMSPLIIGCIVALGVTFIGMVTVIILLIKKK